MLLADFVSPNSITFYLMAQIEHEVHTNWIIDGSCKSWTCFGKCQSSLQKFRIILLYQQSWNQNPDCCQIIQDYWLLQTFIRIMWYKYFTHQWTNSNFEAFCSYEKWIRKRQNNPQVKMSVIYFVKIILTNFS